MAISKTAGGCPLPPTEPFTGWHLTAAAVLSGAAFLVTLAMSYAFNFVLYVAMSRILPALGMVQAVNYHYYMPLWALALCAAVSVACGFASCLVPYYVWKKRNAAKSRAEAKKED